MKTEKEIKELNFYGWTEKGMKENPKGVPIEDVFVLRNDVLKLLNLKGSIKVDESWGSVYYPIFKYLADNHNLILTDSEIQDLFDVVHKFYADGERAVSDISAEVLGLDNPFPLKDVLQNLVNASEYLLNNKNYDGQDYEEIGICVQRAKEIIKKLNETPFVNERNSVRWIKASERLPPNNAKVIIRDCGLIYFDSAASWDSKITDYEWLDESQPKESDAETDKAIDYIIEEQEKWKDSEAIAFAEFLRKNNMGADGFGGWGRGELNTNFYGSKTEDLYKHFKESNK